MQTTLRMDLPSFDYRRWSPISWGATTFTHFKCTAHSHRISIGEIGSTGGWFNYLLCFSLSIACLSRYDSAQWNRTEIAKANASCRCGFWKKSNLLARSCWNSQRHQPFHKFFLLSYWSNSAVLDSLYALIEAIESILFVQFDPIRKGKDRKRKWRDI